jgi:hypothetical protein
MYSHLKNCSEVCAAGCPHEIFHYGWEAAMKERAALAVQPSTIPTCTEAALTGCSIAVDFAAQPASCVAKPVLEAIRDWCDLQDGTNPIEALIHIEELARKAIEEQPATGQTFEEWHTHKYGHACQISDDGFPFPEVGFREEGWHARDGVVEGLRQQLSQRKVAKNE